MVGGGNSLTKAWRTEARNVCGRAGDIRTKLWTAGKRQDRS